MALSRKVRRYRGWLAFGALALVALAVWFFAIRPSKAADSNRTTYTTSAATVGTVSATVSGSGNLEVDDEADVYPDAEGTVASVKVEEGDTVDEGDVLYTLDADDAESATSKAYNSYRTAKASVTRASADLTKAKATLSKLQKAADEPTSTVSSADIKSAKADVTSAKAALASAKSSRSSAYSDYQDAKDAEDSLMVTAPVSGTVWAVNIEEGDAVGTGSGSSSSSNSSASASSASSGSSTSSTSSGTSSVPVVVVPDEPLVATLAINEVDLPSLKVGQRADLEFDAIPDLTMTGKVTKIAKSGTVSSGVVTFDVTVTLDVTDKKLKPGMTVAATIVTDVARNAVLVPNAAVKSDSTTGDSYVLILNADGTTTQQVTVTTGIAGDTNTQIVSGVKKGDKVVTATSTSSDSSSSSGSSGSSESRSGGGIMGGMMGGPPSGGPGGN